jgi:hypothetical protein
MCLWLSYFKFILTLSVRKVKDSAAEALSICLSRPVNVFYTMKTDTDYI